MPYRNTAFFVENFGGNRKPRASRRLGGSRRLRDCGVMDSVADLVSYGLHFNYLLRLVLCNYKVEIPTGNCVAL